MQSGRLDGVPPRNGDWGPAYIIQGPTSDIGLLTLRPGDEMTNHIHHFCDESFIVIDGEEYGGHLEDNGNGGYDIVLDDPLPDDLAGEKDVPITVTIRDGDGNELITQDGTIDIAGKKAQPYRVMVTAIDVNPVTMDVTLEWCVTNALDSGTWKRLTSVDKDLTEIRYAETLEDPGYAVNGWLDLRADAKSRNSGAEAIPVTPKDAATHTAVILKGQMDDFNKFVRNVPGGGVQDPDRGFFYVIVHGVLAE